VAQNKLKTNKRKTRKSPVQMEQRLASAPPNYRATATAAVINTLTSTEDV